LPRIDKPFRTAEDCFVHLGLAGYLLRIARLSNWPEHVRQSLASLACAVAAIAEDDPRSPAVHVALAGCLDQSTRLVEQLDPLWAEVAPMPRRLWERDRQLLSVAATARQKRLAAAWQRLHRDSSSNDS
jgi:hypothetical protein